MQAELDHLRTENIRLREQASATLAVHLIKLDRDWFVMPGPTAGAPPIRLWILNADGPRMIGELVPGVSLTFQQVAAEPSE